MSSISSHEIQSLSYPAVPLILYRSRAKLFLERHLCSFWKRTVVPTTCYFVWLENSFCPLGAKQMEICTKSGTPHQKSTWRSISATNTANVWTIQFICVFYAVCCCLLTCPSFWTWERPHFSSLCSPDSWAEVCLKVTRGWFCVLHPLSYNNTQLKNVKHGVTRSRSCQPLLSSSLCVCVEPFTTKEIFGAPAAYGRGCFQIIYGTEGRGLALDMAVLGLQLDSVTLKVFSNLHNPVIHFRLLHRRNKV